MMVDGYAKISEKAAKQLLFVIATLLFEWFYRHFIALHTVLRRLHWFYLCFFLFKMFSCIQLLFLVGELSSQCSTNPSEAGYTRTNPEGPAIEIYDTRYRVKIYSINVDCALNDAEKHWDEVSYAGNPNNWNEGLWSDLSNNSVRSITTQCNRNRDLYYLIFYKTVLASSTVSHVVHKALAHCYT